MVGAEILQRIARRREIRRQLFDDLKTDRPHLNMICESLDDYIEHRIRSDKVLEGILQDIQGGISLISEEFKNLILPENENHPPDKE